MKNITYLIIILIFPIILFSCKGNEHSQELAQLDSLQLVLHDIEKQLFSIDTTTVIKYYKKAKANLLYIQRNYKDTMDLQTGLMLSDYNSTKKSLKKLLETFTQQVDELLYSKGQLFDLAKDLKNDLVLEEKYEEYYPSEIKAIKQLNQSVNNLSKWAEKAIPQFEERNPKVKKLMEEIERSN